MKLRSALLAATVLVAPVAAKAENISGLYIGAGAGANFELSNLQFKSVSFPNLKGGVAPAGGGTLFNNSNTSLGAGPIGVASIGYGLGNGLRLEIQGGVSANPLDKISNTNGVTVSGSAGGYRYNYLAMVNALYDVDLASMGVATPIIPYVGVGVGYGWQQFQNARFYGTTPPVTNFPGGASILYRTTSGQGNFAYQFILGGALPISSVPGLALTLEYRFFGIVGGEKYNFQYLSSTPYPVGTSTRATANVSNNYNSAVMIGFRYAFNAAPAPVPPPPPPPRVEAARTYLVFFDWDKYNLTDRAKQIIAEAAQATTRVQVTRIEVNGNTDTTGTAKYNQALSVRRANAVAAELVRLGVPQAAITAQGFGFTRLLVPTGPGVREPQNRRVEIVLK